MTAMTAGILLLVAAYVVGTRWALRQSRRFVALCVVLLAITVGADAARAAPAPPLKLADAAQRYNIPIPVLNGLWVLEANNAKTTGNTFGFPAARAAQYGYPLGANPAPATIRSQATATAHYLHDLYTTSGSWPAAISTYSGGAFTLHDVQTAHSGVQPITNPPSPTAPFTGVVNTAGNVASAVAGAADCVANPTGCIARFATDGAEAVLKLVANVAAATTSPDLNSSWFAGTFKWTTFYAAGIGILIALLAIGSGVIRGDGEILGAVVFGIIRAAVTTSVVIAMTVLLLRAADGISSDVIAAMPAHAFDTLAHSWASSSLPAAIATTMLGFVAAFAMVIAALVLLVEFVFRNAAIYVAVAFLPVTLALAIHPGLASAQQKLIRILGMFVMFSPSRWRRSRSGFKRSRAGSARRARARALARYSPAWSSSRSPRRRRGR